LKVLVAGASGTIGRPLVRVLAARGHEVIGLTRSESNRSAIEALGARAVVADALDEAALAGALAETRPSDVVDLLTSLPADGARQPSQLVATNLLRTVGTAHLVGAAVSAGCRRLVAESFLTVYGDGGPGRPCPNQLRDEEAPLSALPQGSLRESVVALRSLEKQLRDARDAGRIETVALRLGAIHGPAVPSTAALREGLRARRVAVPRGSRGTLSFVHVEDAAGAFVAALEAASPAAVYNVADDEPMPLTAYLELAAEVFGAPAPRRAPVWLLRLVAPVFLAVSSLRIPLSNTRARRELGWRPAFTTSRAALEHAARAAEERESP
jgi:nucleoside-diphosphate-sugar epimerase